MERIGILGCGFMATVHALRYDEIDVDDSATGLLRLADGRTVSVDTSWHGTCEPERACVVCSTEAGAAFEIGESELSLVSADADEQTETVAVDDLDMHLAEDRAFLKAVAGDREPPAETIEEALTIQRVIAALYESSESGTAVRLDSRSTAAASAGDDA